jgi:hypothetical protein
MASELGALTTVVVLFAILVLILWVLLPFAVFGTKPLLREILAELKTLNAARATAPRDPGDSARARPAPADRARRS